MKSIKEIENMSLEQLEAVSMDENIVIPEGLNQRLADNIRMRKSVEKFMKGGMKYRRHLMSIGIAASVALMIGIGFSLTDYMSRPKDTFDDPYLAYAEVQKAFNIISDGLQRGIDMTDDYQQKLDKAVSVFSE